MTKLISNKFHAIRAFLNRVIVKKITFLSKFHIYTDNNRNMGSKIIWNTFSDSTSSTGHLFWISSHFNISSKFGKSLLMADLFMPSLRFPSSDEVVHRAPNISLCTPLQNKSKKISGLKTFAHCWSVWYFKLNIYLLGYFRSFLFCFCPINFTINMQVANDK